MEGAIEISLILGRKCNLSCSHCLNDSGPSKKDYDITTDDFVHLINEIEKNENITTLSFVGGEPLLYSDQIYQFLSLLKAKLPVRKFEFNLTTNGSLLPGSSEFLNEIRFASISISYSKFHSKQVDSRTIREAVSFAKRYCQNVRLLVDFDGSDINLSAIQIGRDLDVRLTWNEVIKSGRQRSSCQQIPMARGQIECPNLAKRSGLVLKLTYYPGGFFSYCCGPLVYDSSHRMKIFSARSIGELLQSRHHKMMQVLRNNPVLINSRSACENCVNFWESPVGKRFAERSISSASKSIVIDEVVQAADFQSSGDGELKIRKIGVLEEGSGKDLSNHELGSLNISNEFPMTVLKTKGIETSEELKTHSQNFIVSNFYRRFSKLYSDEEIDEFERTYLDFFQKDSVVIAHTLKEEMIALLLIARIERHSLFGESLNHIGYWGMSDRIDRKEVRACIRQQWRKEVEYFSMGRKTIVIVDDFNLPSARLAEAMGFRFVKTRFDFRN